MPVYEPPIEPENMDGSPPHESQTIDPLYKNHPKWVNYSNPLIKKTSPKRFLFMEKGVELATRALGSQSTLRNECPMTLLEYKR